MKKHAKFLSLFLALAMCLSLLAGCGSSSSSSGSSDSNSDDDSSAASTSEDADGSETAETEAAETDGYIIDELTVSCSSDGGTFDPYTRGGWGKMAVGDLIFQYLGDLDNEGTVHWTIAKSVEAEDDGLTYTITLWDCVYDSIGNNITADDVVWRFEKYRDEGLGSSFNFDHWEIISDYELQWVCSSEFVAGELEKNLTNFPVLDQETYEDYCGGSMANNPIGTGAYVLTDYTVSSNFTLEANEDFWMNNLDEDEVDLWVYSYQNVRQINYEIIQDTSFIAMALENGDIDIADTLSNADITAFSSNDDFNMVLMPVTAATGIIFNCSDDSVCGSLEMRQAICYALDVATIVANCEAFPTYEVYGVAPNAVDAPEEWLTGEDRDYYEYDLEKAKEPMEEAGYNGETITLAYGSSTLNDYLATTIQSILNEAGIIVEQELWDKTVEDQKKYGTTEWDIRLSTFGGGTYVNQIIKQFSADSVSAYLEEGMNMFFDINPTAENLYYAVRDEGTVESMEAWDEEFTYNNCYAYAVIGYSNQTACRAGLTVPVGKSNESLMPNAVTLDEQALP